MAKVFTLGPDSTPFIQVKVRQYKQQRQNEKGTDRIFCTELSNNLKHVDKFSPLK